VNHPPDQIAAAAELLADGVDDPAAALMETFGISRATAYRRLGQAESDRQAEAGASRQTVDLGELAMAEYWRLVQGAADPEQRLAALTAMTSAMAKLKVRHLPADLVS
jgi:hypothetical protein